jgi:hypothetical protein
VLVWDNAGTATADTDHFNSVFGTTLAGVARADVQAAFDAWNSRFTGMGPNAAAGQSIHVKLQMDTGGTGNGGVTTITGIKNGLPTSATITLDRGGDTNGDKIGDGAGWFLDPTPQDSAEFNGLQDAFTASAATGAAVGQSDLFTVAVQELTHALGIAGDSSLRLQTGGFLYKDFNGDGTRAKDVMGAGYLYTFEGPDVRALLTSLNVLSTGATDSGAALHTADSPNTFGGLNGVRESGTAFYYVGTRYLPSANAALILHDSYGYPLQPVAGFSNFYISPNQASHNLQIVSAAGASRDVIDVSTDIANNLIVDLTIGSPVPGTGPTASFHEVLPFYQVNSITIASNGFDRIDVDGVFKGMPVSITAGVGADSIFVGRTSENLDLVQSDLSIDGGKFGSNLWVWDGANVGSHDYTIDSATVQRSTFGAVVNTIKMTNMNATEVLTSTGISSFKDSVEVRGVASNSRTTLDFGGRAAVRVGGTSNKLDAIQGGLVINGNGSTVLNVDDSGAPGAPLLSNYAYSVTGGAVTRTVVTNGSTKPPVQENITYSGLASLQVTASAAISDRFDVSSTSTPTTVRGGRNGTAFFVTADSGDLSRLAGALTIDGDLTSSTIGDTVNINDKQDPFFGGIVPIQYIVTQTSVSRISLMPASLGFTQIQNTITYLDLGALTPGSLEVDGSLALPNIWSVQSTSPGNSTTLVAGLATTWVGVATGNLDTIRGPLSVAGSNPGLTVLALDDTQNPHTLETTTYTIFDQVSGRHEIARARPLTSFAPPATIGYSGILAVGVNAGKNTANNFIVQDVPASTQVNIVGGLSSDSVFGPLSTIKSPNVWKITGPGAGSLDARVSFQSVENLFGADSPDRFQFSNGGSVPGVISGGGGPFNFDTLDYSNDSDPTGVAVNLATGAATLVGSGAINHVSGVENVIGSPIRNVLTGDQNNNVLVGGAHNDTIDGGLGDDMIVGGEGLDKLTGGGGHDIFVTGDLTFAGTPTQPVTDAGIGALQVVMDEWEQSAVSLKTRIAHLTGTPGGKNGNSFLLLNSTVLDDHVLDVVADRSSTDDWLVN